MKQTWKNWSKNWSRLSWTTSGTPSISVPCMRWIIWKECWLWGKGKLSKECWKRRWPPTRWLWVKHFPLSSLFGRWRCCELLGGRSRVDRSFAFNKRHSNPAETGKCILFTKPSSGLHWPERLDTSCLCAMRNFHLSQGESRGVSQTVDNSSFGNDHRPVSPATFLVHSAPQVCTIHVIAVVLVFSFTF